MVTKFLEMMLQKVDKYLRDVLGITPVFLAWDKSGGLPFYLRDHYSYFIARILDFKCALMVDTAPEERTPAVIAKHAQQVRERQNIEVIYVKEAVTSYNRKRLIEQRVPFIVPGNQMFLPTLGIDLREHLKNLRESRIKFSPSTQALVLYILYHREIDSIRPSQLPQALGYKKMTIGRSFRELEEAGLGEHKASARYRQLCFAERGKVLWERVLPYFETPVRKRIYVPHGTIIENGISAGLSALARYTALAEPKNPVYAISDEQWKTGNQRGNLIRLPFDEPDSMEIELWNYSPALFAKNGIADPLSLFLSLKESRDERVQAALDKLMGDIRW